MQCIIFFLFSPLQTIMTTWARVACQRISFQVCYKTKKNYNRKIAILKWRWLIYVPRKHYYVLNVIFFFYSTRYFYLIFFRANQTREKKSNNSDKGKQLFIIETCIHSSYLYVFLSIERLLFRIHLTLF